MKGILGRKVGMTQVFTKTGVLVPVTVIEVEPNVITQIKTKENDGYEAIQLGFSTKREKLSNRPAMGHIKKANTTPKRFLKEIRGIKIDDYKLGQEIKVDIFEQGDMVDVSGISKGKGFQGVVKRYGFTRGPMGHGSHHHRATGSLGTRREKRVQIGHKMPGHMGYDTVTVQNLEVVAVDLENNIILIKGNVPGPKKSLVIIRSAVKKGDKKGKIQELISYIEEEPIVEETTAEETATPEETTEEVVEGENVEEPAVEAETIEEEQPVEEEVKVETTEEEQQVEETKEETKEETVEEEQSSQEDTKE